MLPDSVKEEKKEGQKRSREKVEGGRDGSVSPESMNDGGGREARSRASRQTR